MVLAKILDKKAKDEDFGKEFKTAGDLHDKLPALTFKMFGAVFKESRSGMRLESIFWFMTAKEFVFRWRLEPKVVGIKVHVIMDEEGGRLLKGCVIKPEPDDPPYAYRRVILFTDKVTIHHEELLGVGRQLRDAQPKELFETSAAAEAKTREEDRRAL
jgi:hypothetical protein